MSAEWFFSWWNLIYTVPFSLAIVYLFVYSATGLTLGEADADAGPEVDSDADLHVDADVDTDAEVDTDADVHGDVDSDADADHDAEHDHAVIHGHAKIDMTGSAQHWDTPILVKAMGFVGLGKVPLSISLMVLLLTWGLIGFLINRLLTPVVPREWWVLLGSLPAASIGSALVTHNVVRFMARWMPTTETYAEPIAKLVGRSAAAVYNIDQDFGMAAVKDRKGELFQISCRVYPDRQPIAKGERVLLVEYDTHQKFFYVTVDDLEK